MNNSDLSLDELSKIPFFYNMPEEGLQALLDVFSIRTLSPLRYVFKEGDIADGMYFVIEGQAKVVKKTDAGSEIQLEEIYAHNFFGEMALIDGRRRGASVVTLSDFKAIKLSCDAFETLKKNYPELAIDIIRKIAHMLALKLRKSSNNTSGII